MSTPNSPEPVGLLAAWGNYPFVVAEALRRQGRPVHCAGVKGHVNLALADLCDSFQTVGIARLGAAIRHFRRHGVHQATMAGKIHKVNILDPNFIWTALPDWCTVKTFLPHFVFNTADRKDDTLLGAIVNTFAKNDIHFAPATDFAPELLIKAGSLSKRQPTASEWKDIAFGWHLAKEMGRLDVGQSVAVCGRAVVAVEAVEGTDQCILRAGELVKRGGFTLVKVAKPQQDMRFDVPTVGAGTMRNLVQAGGKVLALEAGKTIVLDRPEIESLARQHGIAVIAVNEAMIQGRLVAA